MKIYSLLLFFYLANSIPLPAQSIVTGNGEKEYINTAPTPIFTDKTPAYCHMEKITIRRLNDETLQFTMELHGQPTEKDERSISYIIHIDIDKKVSTGGVAMWGFGSDIGVSASRKANEKTFEAAAHGVKMDKDVKLEMKKCTMSGNVLLFVVESELFKKYPSFRFYATAGYREDVGKRNKVFSAFASQMPASGSLEF